jgi:translation initiation factor 1 (eIF-1/SUI1)
MNMQNDSSDSDSDSDIETNKKLNKKVKIRSSKGLKHLETLKKSVEIEEFNNNDDFFNNDYFVVNIRVKQRNSRKHTTTIEDVPDKYLLKDKLDIFLVKLRNAISSRATYKEDKNGKYIEVSGNKTDIMVDLLSEYLNCSKDMIKVYGN